MDKQSNINIYNFTYGYLKGITPDGANIEKHFIPDSKPNSLEDVFIRFIISAQNYQSMPNVIQFFNREPTIKEILHNYNIPEVATFSKKELYDTFREAFDIKTPDTKKNSWYKWSCSIVDIAKFLSNFQDLDDFDTFVKLFSYNNLSSIALPLLMQSQIKGMGFALTCDALKELGYEDYPKPDVHLIEVFSEAGICRKDPMEVFDAIVKMSKDCNEVGIKATPYKIDKMFWLICSGFYYKDNIRTKGRKKELIQELKILLNKE